MDNTSTSSKVSALSKPTYPYKYEEEKKESIPYPSSSYGKPSYALYGSNTSSTNQSSDYNVASYKKMYERPISAHNKVSGLPNVGNTCFM